MTIRGSKVLPNHVQFRMVYDDQTITQEFSPDRDIHEFYELFEQFLAAMGFGEQSINEANMCHKCKTSGKNG